MMQASDYKAIFENQDDKIIAIYMLNSNVTNLGPGKRYGIWVQGCLKHCPACVSPDSQNQKNGTIIECNDLIKDILFTTDIDGITVSGGEPILQWKALKNILFKVKNTFPSLNILLYTGYSFEKDLLPYLHNNSNLYNREFADFFSLLDWWVDGQYDIEKDDGKGLRGSSNQLLYGNIYLPNNNQRILCKQIMLSKWQTLITGENIICGSILFVENDIMNDFAIQERLPEWDTQMGQIIGIPTKTQLSAFQNLRKK